MGSYTTLPDDVSEVDIIIAGGGTAACIIAGRLLDHDPSLSLLVVEAGRDNRGVDNIEKPGLFLAHIMPDSQTVKCYTCNKSDKLAGREAVIQTGNVLGGGSSVNFMMYTRAQRDDLDRINMPGWNAKELLPYMKKLETYHGPGDKSVHGTDGPVHVSYGTHESKIATPEFLRALSTLGHPTVTDVNDLDTCNATSRWLKTVSPDGVRQDTARCYLHSKMDNPKYPNLHILTETKVSRVLLNDENRAVGIEFSPNSAIHPDPSGNAPGGSHALPKRQVKARRQVIVSSGAIGTPLVLQRSGIGNPSILKRAGVPCKVDLPGVGREYQDHHLILYPYSTSLPAEETIDDVLRDPNALVANKDSRLGWNAVDMCSKLRPSEEEVAQLSPELQKRWAADFRDVPNRPIMLMGLLNCFLGDPSTVAKDRYYVSVANYTAYPYSRGHIYITGPDANDKPDFDAGFLSDEGDVDVAKHVWAYKKGRDAMRRTNMYRGEIAAGHPRFPEGSAAACVESTPSDAPVKYTKEDDQAIEQYVREHVNSTWHSIATARMAPQDDYGVVDKDLNVYGTKGLKLADLSIFPVNIGANTNNTAMLIGEKAADILIKELQLN